MSFSSPLHAESIFRKLFKIFSLIAFFQQGSFANHRDTWISECEQVCGDIRYDEKDFLNFWHTKTKHTSNLINQGSSVDCFDVPAHRKRRHTHQARKCCELKMTEGDVYELMWREFLWGQIISRECSWSETTYKMPDQCLLADRKRVEACVRTNLEKHGTRNAPE